MQIESVVGDEQKQGWWYIPESVVMYLDAYSSHPPVSITITCSTVLKNVNKIERFIIDQLRKMLDDELVFPSYQCVQMS